MKKKIGRKVYNTEKSKYIAVNTEGSFGDPHGIEERLYKKGDADFFLHVSGGIESQYPEEDIIPIELDDAREWMLRCADEATVEKFITEKDLLKEEADAAKKKK